MNMNNLDCGLLLLLIISLLVSESCTQGNLIWKDYGEDCSKHAINIGFPPGLSDYWFINVPCKNYSGSVGCITATPESVGKCECNLGDAAYFDETKQVCLGKTGAFCTAEKTSLVPEKLCTPNADCVPVQSEGHSVGTCQCLYGYKTDEESGKCVEDTEIPEEDKSTPRPTTPAPVPERGNIKIPVNLILEALLGTKVGYNETCGRPEWLFPLLNRTTCATQLRTVACIDKQCQCNMGADNAVWDEEIGQCVGLVGSYCLTRKNMLGYKACTVGADCFLEEGVTARHSFGQCKCLYGYDPQPDGSCKRNEAIENPSTKIPGGQPPVITSPTPTTPSVSTIPTYPTTETVQPPGTTPNPGELPQEGDPCTPHLCKTIGWCQHYFRCSNLTQTWERIECGQDLVWNPRGPGAIHGGNCDLWKNIEPDLEDMYRSSVECLRCFWKELGECSASYQYLPPGLLNRNVQTLTCSEGLVFSEDLETCAWCWEKIRKDGQACCLSPN